MLRAEQAPAADTNDKTGKSFVALHIVTTACHGVLNTQFIAPNPKPAWFDALSANLDGAKVLANDWIDNLAPKMTASIPSHVIDYAATYSAVSDEIIQLLTNNPNAKGPNNPVVRQVIELIQALHDQIQPIIADIQATQELLKKWGKDMQIKHDALFTGAANIQSAQADLQTHIEKMNSAIKGFRQQIKAEQEAVMYSQIGVALSLFVAVIGLAFAPVTGGGSLILSGVGLLGLGGSAAAWGVMETKINENFGHIAEDLKNIEDDKRQLIALQSLSLSANTAITAIGTATQALSDVRTLWTTFQNELAGTLDKLNHVNADLSAVVNKAFVKAAQTEWNLAVQFAQQLVGMQVPVEVRQHAVAA